MKKKLLSVTIGTALGVSAVNMPAQADALLAPFVELGGGVFTFLTLRSDSGGNPLRYGFNYVETDADGNQECTHFNTVGNMTPFDIIQQTVIDPAFGGIDLTALFGDASNPAHLPFGLPTFGYVTVQDDSLEGAFGGNAHIVDTNSGVVFAYKLRNNVQSQDDDDFSQIFVSARSNDYTWYPTGIVDVQWPVLVTGTGMKDASTFGWDGTLTLFNGFLGVFDRDENFLSGNKFKTITCIDVVTLPDLLNAAQLNATVNGGWTWVVQANRINGATGVITLKQEASAFGGGIESTHFENAFPNLPY